MDYRMIVLDLDGTLTNSKKEMTPRTREANAQGREERREGRVGIRPSHVWHHGLGRRAGP